MLQSAAGKGGVASINPVQDLGFVYGRALADHDGQIWEATWMDPTTISSE